MQSISADICGDFHPSFHNMLFIASGACYVCLLMKPYMRECFVTNGGLQMGVCFPPGYLNLEPY